MGRVAGAAAAAWLAVCTCVGVWAVRHVPASTAASARWILGTLVLLTAVLGLVAGWDLVRWWRRRRDEQLDTAWFEYVEARRRLVARADAEAAVAAAAVRATAARIALLEAHLAEETAELEAALRDLDAPSVSAPRTAAEWPPVTPATVEAEPALREELVEVLTELIGRHAAGVPVTAERRQRAEPAV